MAVVLRAAVPADIPQIEALIVRSARGLSAADYRPAQIEGALRGAFGVDTQLLADGTYFHRRRARRRRRLRRLELPVHAVRQRRPGRARFLGSSIPQTQAAKIRAFFTSIPATPAAASGRSCWNTANNKPSPAASIKRN